VTDEIRMDALKATCDEIYVPLEAASRFATKKEMQQLAIMIDELARNVFGEEVWRNATYEGI